jgi:Cu(I)-responsive transcriptional regulator
MIFDEKLSIGHLAKDTGTKIVTIRYYEQIGLLPNPARTASNYRAYTHEHVRRLRFIRRCRDLGFRLDEVRELLRLSSQQDQECSEVDRLTARHLLEIEAKISDLKRLAGELRRISSCCRGDGLIADCRIIEALSPDDAKRSGSSKRVAGRKRSLPHPPIKAPQHKPADAPTGQNKKPPFAHQRKTRDADESIGDHTPYR